MTIKGKVAETINEYTVMTNLGTKDGVTESQRYGIYKISDPIEDPDSGEDLGQIEYRIARVRPVEIEEKYSIMVTDENTGGLDFSSYFTSVPKSLTKNPSLDNQDVSRGDIVKLMMDLDDEK
ncbi:hypothetical protein AArcSt2_08735 [Natronocalculus amylovorans]|uniref:Uncharacterized protein n=2 Tax=Natronocalculus amylovorans TaxID=2917812 RepID=A0AAE3FY50_9EURY|nr:hypothetical protein [Natronocalculus amylovorans]